MAKLSSEPDTTLYSVDIRLQVGSIAGDPEYHVRMTWSEIEKILRGQAACIRLPSHYGPATEYRFVPLNNVVEITLTDLQWPEAAYIAEAVS